MTLFSILDVKKNGFSYTTGETSLQQERFLGRGCYLSFIYSINRSKGETDHKE